MPLLLLSMIYLINIISHFVLIALYKKNKTDPAKVEDILDKLLLFDCVNLALTVLFVLDGLLSMVGNPVSINNK